MNGIQLWDTLSSAYHDRSMHNWIHDLFSAFWLSRYWCVCSACGSCDCWCIYIGKLYNNPFHRRRIMSSYTHMIEIDTVWHVTRCSLCIVWYKTGLLLYKNFVTDWHWITFFSFRRIIILWWPSSDIQPTCDLRKLEGRHTCTTYWS